MLLRGDRATNCTRNVTRNGGAMISLVMTLLGPDRPGVVERVSQVVSQHGANWLESRMAHLAGQFAGIVHVAVPADRAPVLVQALQGLTNEGLAVIVHTESHVGATPSYAPMWLHVLGADRPGIVHEVTRVLAEQQVNVEDLQTECLPAPMSGDRLFQATARLRLPPGLTAEQLQMHLERIAHDLMVDIQLQTQQK